MHFRIKHERFIPFFPSKYYDYIFDEQEKKIIGQYEDTLCNERTVNAINSLNDKYTECMKNKNNKIDEIKTRNQTAIDILHNLVKDVEFFIGKVNSVYDNLMKYLTIFLSALVFGVGNGVLRKDEDSIYLLGGLTLIICLIIGLVIVYCLMQKETEKQVKEREKIRNCCIAFYVFADVLDSIDEIKE